MSEAPAPLTDVGVDVSGLPGFMLNVVRLLSSELAAVSTGDEFKAAVLLWCRSWQQTPACSLPDDDRVLASFAGLGADLKKWRKVQEVALRGFVRCSDGRLYHPVLVEDAKRASKARQQRRDAIARRYGDGNGKPTAVGSPVLPVQRRDETRRREDSEANASGASAPLPASDQDLVWGEGLDWLASATNRKPDALRSLVGRWCSTYGATAVLAVIRDARAQSPPIVGPVPWIEAALKTRSKPNEQADKAESRRSAERIALVVARLNRKPEQGVGQLPGGDADAVLPAVSSG